MARLEEIRTDERRVTGKLSGYMQHADESSLGDFHSSEDNQELIAKINEVYGVDVSDIESAKLWQILDRIAASESRR